MRTQDKYHILGRELFKLAKTQEENDLILETSGKFKTLKANVNALEKLLNEFAAREDSDQYVIPHCLVKDWS